MSRVLRSLLPARYTDSSSPERPDASQYTAISVGDEAGPDPLLEHTRRHGRGVYWCFWILGAGILLSWNVLICTIPLLASFFDERSATHANLASYLSTTFCFSNLLFLGLAQRDVGKTSPSPRIRWSLYLLHVTSLLMLFPVLPILLPRLSPSSPLLLPLLLLMTTSLACSTAYLQSAVFALAALWGSDETLAVMSGQGGIAVLVSFAQVILAVLGAMRRSAPETGTEASVQSTLAGVGLWAISAVGAAGCIYAHTVLKAHVEYPNVLAPVIARGAESARVGGMGGPGGDVKQGVTGRVFRKNKELEMAVAWVFVVTLSVFPPITTAIVSTHSPPPRFLQPSVFIPLHFLLFNVGDFIGRTYLPAIPSLLITNPRRVLALSLARTLFVPLFLACNVAVSAATTGSKPLLNSDTAYFLILIAFGLTNGYISSLSMILASSPALNPKISDDEKDVAGTLAAFCLVAGLAGGSVCSFGVNWLVRGSVFG